VDVVTDSLTPQQRALLHQMETPGSVLYGILAWMSDSMMLARLRPAFMDLFAVSTEFGCRYVERGGRHCSEVLPDVDEWCPTCRLQAVIDRIQAVAKP